MSKKDTDKKLVFITEIAFDLENQLPAQLKFLKPMHALHKLLHLRLKGEAIPDSLKVDELKDYCQKRSLSLQAELIKEINLDLRNYELLKRRLSHSTLHFENAKKHLKSLKEQHALLLPLTKKDTYLIKPTKNTLAKFLSELQIYIDKISSKKSDALSKPDTCPLTQTPIANRAPSMPICKIPIILASINEITQIKARYPHSGTWILKKLTTLDGALPETKKLYFFSLGKLINSKQAAKKSSSKKSLKETSCLHYLNRDVEEEVQRDSEPSSQTELCYTNAGIYYFINKDTQDDNAYKIDFIAAESLIEKQSPQAQIEPQVRNSADNKE